MGIPDQRQFPRVSQIGQLSPMVLKHITRDHKAYIHPALSYKWAHNLFQAVKDLLDISMPEEQFPRFDLTQRFRFVEDFSGRTTGKSFNHLGIAAVRAVILPRSGMIWLGQNKAIGKEIFEKYFTPWIEETDFGRFIKSAGRKTPRISHQEDSSILTLYNRSLLKSMSPDPKKGYGKMQSMRYNNGILNEWTSFPNVEKIPEIVGPIFTNTNLPFLASIRLREVMEKITGLRLGRLTDEDLVRRHQEDGYAPREERGTKLQPWAKVRELFYYNFEAAFGFDYRYGVDDEDLQFKAIKTKTDIISFFSDYDEGDMVYSNKLIYDGSAKRPSDPCYKLHEKFTKRAELPKPLYGQFSIGVDDIPAKWDGIIFDSLLINEERADMLDEDFQRVYGGKWIEGRVQNPFLWQDVLSCCVKGYNGQIGRENPAQEFAGGIDSAQGTDATYKTDKGVLKDARGDDGTVFVYEMGEGTHNSPHKLCFGEMAEDVRSESFAYQIQKIEENFQGGNSLGADWWLIDPGGGGKAVMESLADEELSFVELDGTKHTESFTPMVPWDHENPSGKKNNLVIFSLSNEMLKEAFIAHAKSEKAALQFNDQLNNYLITVFQRAIRRRGVVFPELIDPNDLGKMFKAGKISEAEYTNRVTIWEGLRQIVGMRYVLDSDGKKVKSTHGVLLYKGTGKKDAAMTILYGYLMCEMHVILNRKIKNPNEGANGGNFVSPRLPAIG